MQAGNQIMTQMVAVCSRSQLNMPEFTKMLVEYYETGEMDSLKDFVYENCIDGIDFRQNERCVMDRNRIHRMVVTFLR